MATIYIEAGDQTEALLQYIAGQLPDAELDQIDVDRQVEKSDKLATEPFTAAATLALATTSVIVIARLIEKWLENRKQLDHLRIVADGFKQSDEAGKALADVSKAHAKVSIAYGIPSLPKSK